MRSRGYGSVRDFVLTLFPLLCPVVGASSFLLVTLCPDSWNYSAGEGRRQGRAKRVHLGALTAAAAGLIDSFRAQGNKDYALVAI